MIKDPIRRKLCVMPGSILRSDPPALTIDLVVCSTNERCVPFPSEERESKMRPSFEIG